MKLHFFLHTRFTVNFTWPPRNLWRHRKWKNPRDN